MKRFDKNSPIFANALLSLAFRPLFLGAATFSILSLLMWGLALSGWQFDPYGGVQFWHGHEMLFGFVGAVVVGFLLTAVQSWTGLRAVNGRPLALLLMLWLAGRLLMAMPVGPNMLPVVVDLMFFPVAALFLFIPLLIRNQSRNYFAVLALLLLTFCNGISHFAVLNDEPILQSQALFSAMLLVTVMMAIIGGRVIPMFTANATQIPARPRQKWLDTAALGLLWSLLLFSLLAPGWQAPDLLLSIIYGAAAILIGVRCAGWRFLSTLKHPLLWALQLGYGWIVIGLLLFSGHYAGLEIPASIAMHSLTAGAMGTLILSMMSRVSLGHTGHPLTASRLISVSLIVITLAALTRVFGVWFLASIYQQIIMLSMILWCVAYGLFLIKYTPLLIQPRADGKAD